MSKRTLGGIVALAALAGCGLEGLFSNVTHDAYDRPASKVAGTVAWSGPARVSFAALDGAGNVTVPFQWSAQGGRYEVRLPSSRYSMVRVQGRAGALALRTLVPLVEEESAVESNLDAQSMTETLIVEAWLGANGKTFSQLTPAAYVGNGVDTGTRAIIRQRMELAGPTRELLQMVERLIGSVDLQSGATDADLFRVPELESDYTVTRSPVSGSFLARNPVDYDGDGIAEGDTADFDAKLAEVAQLFSPEGCPDTENVRLVFIADFRANGRDGNGTVVDRFKWTTDLSGKKMFFVGWVHEDSPIQDPEVNARLGASVPNQVAMFDDGTNGDEAAADGIYTLYVDVPRGLRVGYKYTWGFRGQAWTGSEEWPGNSRIIQVDDLNGDDFVVRYDIYADEATNKDRSNLNRSGAGVVDWDTDLRGCGRPEAREQPYGQQIAQQNTQVCGGDSDWVTPSTIGPLTLACPASNPAP